MAHSNIDEALERLRDLYKRIINDSTDTSAAFELAEQCAQIDEHLIGGGFLPKDWEVGKRLIWGDGRGGSKVLLFNEVVVGHVYPCSESEWVFRADLMPSPELPYKVDFRLDKAKSIEDAIIACEVYVREQTRNVFDPWKVLQILQK